MNFPAPSRLRLDGAALVANWKIMARLSGSAATGAAVKANAYGLGARDVVPRLWAAGCRDFFVAHWGEAEEIADLIPVQHIAVLNGVCRDDVRQAAVLGAVPVLNTPSQIALWRAAGGGRCHVMIDSGMNRLGVGAEQLHDGLFDGLDVDILMSHLASADEQSPQNAMQLERYRRISEGLTCKRRSLANSAGIALGPDYHFDLTRPGLALYGGVAHSTLGDSIRQVVLPQARVLQTRKVASGAMVGYNATYIAEHEMTTATMAIGYADGYYRAFSNRGFVCVKGIDCPIVGRVSMDLITVDVTSIPSLSEGDWCDIHFELPSASHISGVSQYELLTGLSHRAERYWI